MNKTILKQSIQILITFVLFLILSSCRKSDDTITDSYSQTNLLPEFFIEKGSDNDSSYISLSGVRKSNDTLNIQATSWGVVEYGLVLVPQYSAKAILFKMIGKCGTVPSRTWRKVTLGYNILPEMQDTLQQIGFTNSRDTLMVTRTKVK